MFSLIGAHQNTLESLPQIIAATMIVGLKYPIYAASLCGLWSVSRFFYTIGYSTGDPARVRNFPSHFQLVQQLMVHIIAWLLGRPPWQLHCHAWSSSRWIDIYRLPDDLRMSACR